MIASLLLIKILWKEKHLKGKQSNDHLSGKIWNGCIYNTTAAEQHGNHLEKWFFQKNHSDFFLSRYTHSRELTKHSWWKDGGIPASLARKSQPLVILPQVSQSLGRLPSRKLFLAKREPPRSFWFQLESFSAKPHTYEWTAPSESFRRVCNNWLTPVWNEGYTFYMNAIKLNQRHQIESMLLI